MADGRCATLNSVTPAANQFIHLKQTGATVRLQAVSAPSAIPTCCNPARNVATHPSRAPWCSTWPPSPRPSPTWPRPAPQAPADGTFAATSHPLSTLHYPSTPHPPHPVPTPGGSDRGVDYTERIAALRCCEMRQLADCGCVAPCDHSSARRKVPPTGGLRSTHSIRQKPSRCCSPCDKTSSQT